MSVQLRQAPEPTTTGRILLVEDDAALADVITRTLDEQGHVTSLAARGGDALAALRDAEFEVVLLDLLLPDVDGLTLLERLLALRPGQRVLVVSALSNVEAKVRCLDRGAADYLAKPFALDELAARVRAHVREAAPRPAGRFLGHGMLELDTQRRVATVAGATVRLSTREFFLLEYLLQRANEVCSRSELLEHVWGLQFDPGTNVVDVYVRRLRRKLDGCSIETVRNVGYCLLVA